MANGGTVVTLSSMVPDHDHFAILWDVGAGLQYEAFKDRVAWQAAIDDAYRDRRSFKALMVQTIAVKVEISINRPAVEKPGAT